MGRFSYAFLKAAALVASIALTVPAVAEESQSASPPPGAQVLFDGKSLAGWVSLNGKPAGWTVKDGYIEVGPRKGDIMTDKKFGPDFKLHVEFWLPLMADKTGQARANSGVYLQGRYEVQVLDSYNNKTYPDGACGALYKILTPSKNASKPPEQWQTYDIDFHAPRVDAAGKVTKKGRITVVQNGETIIDNGEFDRPTDGAMDKNMRAPGPIRLQDHGALVRFRNIWLVQSDATTAPTKPSTLPPVAASPACPCPDPVVIIYPASSGCLPCPCPEPVSDTRRGHGRRYR